MARIDFANAHYNGDVRFGEPHGYGEMYYDDGSMYEGGGKTDNHTDTALCIVRPAVSNTSESGREAFARAKALNTIQTAKNTTANGKTTRRKAKAFTTTQTATGMKACGKTASTMGRASSILQMATGTRLLTETANITARL